jgi:hypothetical protein
VVEVKNPTQIIPGAYFTGNIERATGYEKVPPSLLIKRGEKPEPDDFRGEQAFGREMPGEFTLNTAGTKYTFTA